MEKSKCLWCGKETITLSNPSRKKKFCDNHCQMQYQVSKGEFKHIPEGITKEKLFTLYEKEQKSVLSISKIIGKSPRQVSRYLKRFGIKARPFSTKGLKTRLGAVLSEETKDKIRIARLKEGRHIHKEYIMIYKPEHPFNSKGYVPEHRLVVESYLKRYLQSDEIIHHIDGNKKNNDLKNLQITTRIGHMQIHQRERKKISKS